MKMIDKINWGPHSCPVCGKYFFNGTDTHDTCPVCDWEDNSFQREYPDEGGLDNLLCLNDAREQFKEHGTVLTIDMWERWEQLYLGWAKKLKNLDKLSGRWKVVGEKLSDK